MKIESVTFNGGNDNRYIKCQNWRRIWFKIKPCNNMRSGNRTKKKNIFFGMF